MNGPVYLSFLRENSAVAVLPSGYAFCGQVDLSMHICYLLIDQWGMHVAILQYDTKRLT